MKKILFLGDSFTWGEGLELYMDKEPFKSMRNQQATDNELRDISDYKDTEVEEWRASNRFVNYVDGFEKYVQPNNGGNFHIVIRNANLLTKRYLFQKDDVIVIQIPPADRSFFHSNVFWKKPKSPHAGTFPQDEEIPIYENLLNQGVQNLLNDNEVMESLTEIMGYDSIEDMLKNSDEIFDKLAYRNTKLFYYSYIFDLMQRFDVYFIGPWGYENHKSFSKCDEFKDKLIPMVYNGKEYDSLQTLDKGMARNNEIFEIAKEFRGTNNNHPTPKAHKIIGESINKFFIDKWGWNIHNLKLK